MSRVALSSERFTSTRTHDWKQEVSDKSANALQRLCASSIHVGFLFAHATDVQYVVAPDEDLTQITPEASIYPLFGIQQLQIHVWVNGFQCALVLHAPLKFDKNQLSREIIEEWFRIDWYGRHVEQSNNAMRC